MSSDAYQLVGDLLGRQHEINRALSDGAVRHTGLLRGVILRERDATLGLDGAQTGRTIRGSACQNHADRTMFLIFGQRSKEPIDRTVDRMWLTWLKV